MTDPKDHKWVKPWIDGQAVWNRFFGNPFELELQEWSGWYIGTWSGVFERNRQYVVANHPLAIAPPDDLDYNTVI